MSIATTVSSRGPLPQLSSHLDRVAKTLRDGVGERVPVQSHERGAPEVVRLEDVVGLHLHQEPLVLVDRVAGGRPPGERTGGCAVDPADRRPEIARADHLQEAELEVDAVDAAAREHEGRVHGRRRRGLVRAGMSG